MPRRRPADFTAFAIINFLAGGLLFLCTGVNQFETGFNMKVNGRDVTDAYISYLNDQIPGYSTNMIVLTVVGFALAAGLVVAGVGLLLKTAWGRWLAIACSAVGVCHHTGFAILQLFFVNPARTRFLGALSPVINLAVFPREPGPDSLPGGPESGHQPRRLPERHRHCGRHDPAPCGHLLPDSDGDPALHESSGRARRQGGLGGSAAPPRPPPLSARRGRG
jgi:hypothetical protein